MTEEEKQQYIEYANSFNPPMEASFLTPAQLDQVNQERRKYESSAQFVKSILNNDDFEERINKSIIEGKIYSISQMALEREKLHALDDGDGTRIDVNETVISRSGQSVIMSGRLQDLLGFESDGYVLKDELNELVNALQADGVPGPEIDRVTAAMNKFGAIILQRGIFVALKGMLEEAIEHSLTLHNFGSSGAKPQPADKPVGVSGAQPKQGEEMPVGFIEYLKNNDKEFDRVEHEVMNDPQFQEFFSTLKKHYTYYQTLPADRMAHEIIVRPQLWSKLSPQTKAWVQTVVERNREAFRAKVDQVAVTSGAGKLDELKKSLGK
jgi:hypothetical protein